MAVGLIKKIKYTLTDGVTHADKVEIANLKNGLGDENIKKYALAEDFNQILKFNDLIDMMVVKNILEPADPLPDGTETWKPTDIVVDSYSKAETDAKLDLKANNGLNNLNLDPTKHNELMTVSSDGKRIEFVLTKKETITKSKVFDTGDVNTANVNVSIGDGWKAKRITFAGADAPGSYDRNGGWSSASDTHWVYNLSNGYYTSEVQLDINTEIARCFGTRAGYGGYIRGFRFVIEYEKEVKVIA